MSNSFETRILGYGSEYNVELTDPFTGEQQKTSIDFKNTSKRNR